MSTQGRVVSGAGDGQVEEGNWWEREHCQTRRLSEPLCPCFGLCSALHLPSTTCLQGRVSGIIDSPHQQAQVAGWQAGLDRRR